MSACKWTDGVRRCENQEQRRGWCWEHLPFVADGCPGCGQRICDSTTDKCVVPRPTRLDA